MTDRRFIKCEVCGSIIMVRTQIGWLPGHPIRIHCPNCGILISGECIQEQENVGFGIFFKNAIEIDPDGDDVKYYIEVSGELLTSKIRPFVEDEDEYQLPPFFTTLGSMGDNNHGRTVNIVLMTVQELAIALTRKLDLTIVLSHKVRALAEEGNYNKSIFEI